MWCHMPPVACMCLACLCTPNAHPLHTKVTSSVVLLCYFAEQTPSNGPLCWCLKTAPPACLLLGLANVGIGVTTGRSHMVPS
jgi:hypothetical protein